VNLSLIRLMQRATLRYGDMMLRMFGPQGTGVDLGGWDGGPTQTPAPTTEPPSAVQPTPTRNGLRPPPPHMISGETVPPGWSHAAHLPEMPLPPGLPADQARVPVLPPPPPPPPPEFPPWGVEDYQRIRAADPLLQPGTPLGDLLRDPTTKWPCAIDLGNEHILVARVTIEGCAPTLDVHQGRTLEQWRAEGKTPTCSHFSVIDCH
jgi:hypothetical protein